MRSFMQSSLERELARAKRNGQATLAILMLDIDHFKKFNDQFGHSAGDDVLKQVAGLFRRFTRAEDILCLSLRRGRIYDHHAGHHNASRGSGGGAFAARGCAAVSTT
jgi:predicted signal transduction protein with EAL and GGDEF domain